MKYKIRSRQFHGEYGRKCGSCNYETMTFYCLEPFSWGEAQCAQCFVDTLIQHKAEVSG